MQEISNKTLVYVILLTLGVSLFSTFVSLNRIQTMSDSLSYVDITGLATSSDSGTASINLSASVGITLTQSTIDWGSGLPNVSCTSVQLSTVGTTNSTLNPGNCWGGVGAVTDQTDFIVQNTGTVDVTLDINGTNSTNLLGFGDITTTDFLWRATNTTEAGSCAGNANGTWMPFDDESVYESVCDNFTWTPSADLMEIEINLTFPAAGLVTGQKVATVTFLATNASTV